MKKLLPIFCAIILLSSPAQASSGIFIGLDSIYSISRNEADNSSSSLDPQDDSLTKADSEGYGANLGVRFDPLFLFASAEVFYEKLNSSTRGFQQNTSGIGPNLRLNDRYGAKANIGITTLPWVTPFITYGMANLSYSSDVSKRKTAPLYGIGILFDVPLTDLSIKAAYDIQNLDLNYQSAQSKTTLGVAHLGLTYTF